MGPQKDLPLFPLRKASPYLFLSLSQKNKGTLGRKMRCGCRVSNSILKVKECVTASPTIIITQHKLSAKVFFIDLINTISDKDLLIKECFN